MSPLEDISEIRANEYHPASNSAYRWLKGFMISNPDDYTRYKLAMSIAAEGGNRQAQICLGTIQRLATAQPVSDRYLLGLAWTILSIHNSDQLEAIADKRIDRAYSKDDTEFTLESEAA